MKRNVFHSDLIAHKRQVVSKTVGKINQRLQFCAGHIRVTITFLLKKLHLLTKLLLPKRIKHDQQ